MNLHFPVILVGAADIDSYCGCIDEEATFICQDSVYRAGKRVLERADEIISTFDDNELYEYYQENHPEYSKYMDAGYCFVGTVE